MIARLVLLALAVSLAAGGADAHAACDASRVHTYASAPLAQPGLVQVLPAPGCLPGSDPAVGVGGAFLPASHHGSNVCVADAVALHVTFALARDLDGDGVIAPANGDDVAEGYVTPGCVEAPWGPGADGGWWVLLGPDATWGEISS